MLLSIITVTRNDSKRLHKTMESLKQFYENNSFEHIIVDGASNDDTQSIVKDYVRKYKNIIFKSERDGGIYDGMNKGIEFSSGEYLLFLNSGDEIAIEQDKLTDIIKSNLSKNYQILCLPYLQNWGNKLLKKYSLGQTLNRMPTSHQAMLFSRAFITKHQYNLDYKIAADFNLYHRASLENIKHLNDSPPLCIVEAMGVASRSPLKSYTEYCRIMWLKYTLLKSVLLITPIAFKGILIFSANKIISENSLTKLRLFFHENEK